MVVTARVRGDGPGGGCCCGDVLLLVLTLVAYLR